MFKITVRYGSGDRKAAAVSDDLIIDVPMARIRGEQELAKHLNIGKTSKVKTPHEPDREVGSIEQLSHDKIGLWGAHRVITHSIVFTQDSVYDESTVEQYKLLIR